MKNFPADLQWYGAAAGTAPPPGVTRGYASPRHDDVPRSSEYDGAERVQPRVWTKRSDTPGAVSKRRHRHVAPQPLELAFGRAEIGSLFIAVLIGAFVSGDGQSNSYKGVQLITIYSIIALMFYLMPSWRINHLLIMTVMPLAVQG